MKCKFLIPLASLGFAAFLLAPSQALAASAPALGSAEGFAALAGTAVTCTDSTVTGDVGVWPGTAVTRTNCTINGAVHPGDGVARQAFLDFISAYDNLGTNPPPCDFTLTGTLAGVVLDVPGVYCVDATAKTGTLTLVGDANDVWIFLVRDGAGTGALTGTNFNVVMTGGGEPCNVYWWVEAAATMTTSNFLGTILAGAAITVTGGTFDGHALATAAVTLTGATVTACEATGDGGNERGKCNQGVGNGPEDCDPGNSNQGDPSRSNDEEGGTPGNPGRKGGNGK
jgi:ice-binding like protein